MVTGAKAERRTIETYLARLGRDPRDLLQYQVIQKGISGASTYRVRSTAEDLILKLTLPSSGPVATGRALREIGFYRTMAKQVPLRVPAVVAIAADPGGYALLMTAYQPSPPPGEWQDQEYVEAARQLASFHAAFWKRTERLSGAEWLRRSEVGAADVQRAHRAWVVLQEQPRFGAVLPAATGEWLRQLISRMPAVDRAIQAFPLTVCHGDCNTTNVLRDAAGNLIWADWQEVGAGCGPSDLAFFLQRATVASGTPPYEAVLETYAETLAAATGEDLPLAALRHVVQAAELRSRLLDWPSYLVHAAVPQLREMVDRIRYLAGAMQLPTA